MKIIIVGAGLGGLSAALSFARRGHHVKVLEARPTLSPQGGGINIRPGASRIMHSWGLRPDLEKISEPTGSFLLRNMVTGEIAMRNILYDASDEVDWGTSRELVMKLLYDRAQEAGADVQFDCSVVKTTEDSAKAWLELQDGRKFWADLVLASDGVRSRIRSQILSDLKAPIDPIVSDTTLYGVRVQATQIEARTDVKRLLDKKHAMVWQGKDGFVVSRYSPKLNSCGGLYAIKSENDMKGLWDEKGDIQFVRDFFADSCEDLRAILEVATSCDRWKLGKE
jgi:salicylate hydroxylase